MFSPEHDHGGANSDQFRISAFASRHQNSVMPFVETNLHLNFTSLMSQTEYGHLANFLLRRGGDLSCEEIQERVSVHCHRVFQHALTLSCLCFLLFPDFFNLLNFTVPSIRLPLRKSHQRGARRARAQTPNPEVVVIEVTSWPLRYLDRTLVNTAAGYSFGIDHAYVECSVQEYNMHDSSQEFDWIVLGTS